MTSVIPGTKSVEKLRDNVAAARSELPPETLEAIEELWAREVGAEPVPW